MEIYNKKLKRTKNKYKDKKNMFKKKHCSLKNSHKEVSCLDDKLLIKIGNILNEYHDANIKITKCKKMLHDQISDKLSKMSKCGSEKCWVTIREVKKRLDSDELELFKESFKPNMPIEWEKDFNTWLTTTDLNEIMDQLKDKYPNFHPYNALPIDFDLKEDNQCVSGDLCNIDLNKHFDNGEHNIGVIFNMDKHNEPGSHWTAMYIELIPCCRKTPSIYYFDSIGKKAPKQVMDLVDKLQDQYKSIKGKNMDYLYNDVKHQQGNTECGIYCLHFLETMLKGTEFEYYINNKNDDDYMEKFRQYYFIQE